MSDIFDNYDELWDILYHDHVGLPRQTYAVTAAKIAAWSKFLQWWRQDRLASRNGWANWTPPALPLPTHHPALQFNDPQQPQNHRWVVFHPATKIHDGGEPVRRRL